MKLRINLNKQYLEYIPRLFDLSIEKTRAKASERIWHSILLRCVTLLVRGRECDARREPVGAPKSSVCVSSRSPAEQVFPSGPQQHGTGCAFCAATPMSLHGLSLDAASDLPATAMAEGSVLSHAARRIGDIRTSCLR
jgi:hypothetical protein